MRVLKTKDFARWARKERLDDVVLVASVEENERDNVDEDELDDLKRLARGYLAMTEETMLQGVADGELKEVEYGEP